MFKLFKNLMREDERWLSEPTKPKPPMPECKPYSEPYKPVPDISEPVITLLEELKKDVWEVKQIYEVSHNSYYITHVYKESVKFYLNGGWTRDFKETKTLYYVDWMTNKEKEVVIKALEPVISGQLDLQAQLEKINSREKFSKALLGK